MGAHTLYSRWPQQASGSKALSTYITSLVKSNLLSSVSSQATPLWARIASSSNTQTFPWQWRRRLRVHVAQCPRTQNVLLHCPLTHRHRCRHLFTVGPIDLLRKVFDHPLHCLGLLRFLEDTRVCIKPQTVWEPR